MFKITLFFGSINKEFNNVLGTIYSNVAPVVGTSLGVNIPAKYQGTVVVKDAIFITSETKEESQVVLVSF